jgi:hypothetical protein
VGLDRLDAIPRLPSIHERQLVAHGREVVADASGDARVTRKGRRFIWPGRAIPGRAARNRLHGATRFRFAWPTLV